MKVFIDNYTLDKVEEWLDRFVKSVQIELHNDRIDASGDLSDSIDYRIERQSDGMHAIVESNNYMLYAEGGRKGGKIPHNFIQILTQWIKDKGLSVSPKDDRRFAYFTAMKIKTYGSRRYRDNDIDDVLGKVLDRERPKLNEILENRMVVYVNDNLF